MSTDNTSTIEPTETIVDDSTERQAATLLTFINYIKNNKDIQDLQSVAENIGAAWGYLGTALGIITTLDSLLVNGKLPPGPTEQILDAIKNMQIKLDYDIAQLGNLIRQQIRQVETIVNRNDMADACGTSLTGMNDLQLYWKDPIENHNRLDDAINYTTQAAAFFAELSSGGFDMAQAKTNDQEKEMSDFCFFLPGIVKAGNNWLMAIQSSNQLTDIYEQLLHKLIYNLKTMINQVKQSVDNAHILRAYNRSELKAAPIGRTQVFYGWYHEEFNQRLSYFQYRDEETGSLPLNPQKRYREVWAEATSAREQGVQDELTFLSIPAYEKTLNDWRETGIKLFGPQFPES